MKLHANIHTHIQQKSRSAKCLCEVPAFSAAIRACCEKVKKWKPWHVYLDQRPTRLQGREHGVMKGKKTIGTGKGLEMVMFQNSIEVMCKRGGEMLLGTVSWYACSVVCCKGAFFPFFLRLVLSHVAEADRLGAPGRDQGHTKTLCSLDLSGISCISC